MFLLNRHSTIYFTEVRNYVIILLHIVWILRALRFEKFDGEKSKPIDVFATFTDMHMNFSLISSISSILNPSEFEYM